MLYLSLADSIINYCLSSYGRTHKTSINKNFNLQYRLLKTIVPPKVKQKLNLKEKALFHYCKILNIYDKIELSIVCEAHK